QAWCKINQIVRIRPIEDKDGTRQSVVRQRYLVAPFAVIVPPIAGVSRDGERGGGDLIHLDAGDWVQIGRPCRKVRHAQCVIRRGVDGGRGRRPRQGRRGGG